MILADTSALYSVSVKQDQNHKSSTGWYTQAHQSGETFAVTQLIMAESWFLMARRQGSFYADRLWDLTMSGLFRILELDNIDLGLAMQIRKKYADSGLGFVDATSLAACERYRMEKVFTLDRAHFGIYRPSFAEFLELVPAVG